MACPGLSDWMIGVPMDDQAFRDRSRAESFGTVAGEYDRFRPSYPDALIADLVALNPDRVLDIACGTGKVAVPLLACGLSVLGVEVDPQMADVARGHGVQVEVAAFETWDDEGRSFDLITCGQAWHWIDPQKGAPKAARLLRPEGVLALFWNYDDLDDSVEAAFDEIYSRHAPGVVPGRHHERKEAPYLEALKATGAFPVLKTKHYRWERTYTADEWVGRAATHSDHIGLPDEQRAEVLAALHAEIEARGGSLTAHFGTYTIFGRTTE